MTVHKVYMWPATLLLAFGLAACGGPGQQGQADVAEDTTAAQTEGSNLLKVGDKLFSIPSPVQTVLLIHQMKTPYASGLPLAPERVGQFASKESQALALGVYGADLAYLAVYKDGQKALKTLKAVEELASRLNVVNAFDKELMASFRNSINDEDSLLKLTGTAFRAADKYLKEDQRESVSVRVLAGGWIEGLYLTLGEGGSVLDPRVVARVAEQGHTLDNLIEMLGHDPGATELVASLKELATAYGQVKREYQFVEPTQDVGNKVTYINSTSKTEIAQEALQEIISKVRAIRAAITA